MFDISEHPLMVSHYQFKLIIELYSTDFSRIRLGGSDTMVWPHVFSFFRRSSQIACKSNWNLAAWASLIFLIFSTMGSFILHLQSVRQASKWRDTDSHATQRFVWLQPPFGHYGMWEKFHASFIQFFSLQFYFLFAQYLFSIHERYLPS